MEKITIVLLLFVLISCQRSLELRVRSSGATVPRNHREKLIFDYFNALKDERYADAYKLRVRNNTGTLDNFIEEHAQDHSFLATEISIGEESKVNSYDSNKCGYHYTVYASHPGSKVLTSGSVLIESNPDDPESCLIGYNSAFGSSL